MISEGLFRGSRKSHVATDARARQFARSFGHTDTKRRWSKAGRSDRRPGRLRITLGADVAPGRNLALPAAGTVAGRHHGRRAGGTNTVSPHGEWPAGSEHRAAASLAVAARGCCPALSPGESL